MINKFPFGLTIICNIKRIRVSGKGNIETRSIMFRDEYMTDFWSISLDENKSWGTSCKKTKTLACEILAKYIPFEETESYCSYLFNELSALPYDFNFHIEIPLRKCITNCNGSQS